MKTVQSTAVLAIATATLLAGFGDAKAITLPDNSSCAITGNSNACLKITNTTSSDGIAISAVARNNVGLSATSSSGAAINASSPSNVAVNASSFSSHGVAGSSNAARPFSAVNGFNDRAGYGVVGHNYFFDTSCVDHPGTNCAAAIYGDAGHNTTDTWAGLFHGDVNMISDGEVYFGGKAIGVSDARLKKDVTDVPYGLAQLLELRPVTYKLRDGRHDRIHVGLLAQDVRNIVPELVRSRGQSDVLAINYNGLIPVLVKAVQERERGIQKREARIATLEQRRKRLAASLFTDPLGAVAALGSLSVGMMGFTAGRRRKAAREEG